jgi:hypothetical protein
MLFLTSLRAAAIDSRRPDSFDGQCSLARELRFPLHRVSRKKDRNKSHSIGKV